MIRQILTGAAVVVGGVLAYRYWQRTKGGVDRSEPLQVMQVAAHVGRPGATKVPLRTIPSALQVVASKVRKGAQVVPVSTRVRQGAQVVPVSSRVRRGATLSRPVTLSECCDSLCLPTLERTTRDYPPLSHRVSKNRNLWADYSRC